MECKRKARIFKKLKKRESRVIITKEKEARRI
jgi:hypothetical protein